jgi:predicted dehydrogenase
MKDKLSWGIIGTGRVATDFARAVQTTDGGRVVSAVGTTRAHGEAFAATWGLPAWAESIDALVHDPAVEAVYVATPHPCHEEHALAAIRARKAVLCEKPIAMNAASAARIVEAARATDVFLMEAFMYRCHPLTAAVLARLRDGAIGRVRHVAASFAFRARRDPASRLYDKAQGGGAILDVGGYPLSFARLIAGVVEEQPFAEPVAFHAHGFVGPLGADELASALLRFRSGMTATLTCAVHHDGGMRAEIYGESGKIVLPQPWIPGGRPDGLDTELILHRDGHGPETIPVRSRVATYALEAELVAATLPAVEARWPAMTWADTLGNMRGLDAWLAAVHRDDDPQQPNPSEGADREPGSP